jgi:hypothetical protein
MSSHSRAGLVAAALVAALVASVADATTITLNSDFEAPTFVVGNIGGNPPFSAGQGGWGGYNSVIENGQLVRARIVNDKAYSGTQSLRTTSDSRVIQKSLNPAGGEYPTGSAFNINNNVDWWVQTLVWINPGASVSFALLNGLGSCPLLNIGPRGQITGTQVGQPYVNGCVSQDTTQANLGSGAFGQWLTLEMVHTTSMGQGMEFRITGQGINRIIALGTYGGPGSGSPAFVGLSGDAWWDDVRAGYGAVPAVVPVPGAAALLVSALGLLAGLRRRAP